MLFMVLSLKNMEKRLIGTAWVSYPILKRKLCQEGVLYNKHYLFRSYIFVNQMVLEGNILGRISLLFAENGGLLVR